MNANEIGEFLKGIELFEDLDEGERALLLAKTQVESYPAGAVLFEQNQPRERLFMIFDGKVELFKKSPLGEEKRLAFFRKFDFLGEGALMDEYPHATIRPGRRGRRRPHRLPGGRPGADEGQTPTSSSRSCPGSPGSSPAGCARRRIRSWTRPPNTSPAGPAGSTISSGERDVPYEFYYGIQTLRATENFPISGVDISHFPDLIIALAQVKMAAALANRELGLLRTTPWPGPSSRPATRSSTANGTRISSWT